jgi:orotidine-5'-phosphate decarboxylase
MLENTGCWLKVGMTLYYQDGPKVVHDLKARGFKVFVDLKLHDIPHQVRGAAASLVAAGADMMSIHAVGGPLMMEAALEGIAKAVMQPAADGTQPLGTHEPLTLGITVLTSMDDVTLARVGVTGALDEQVERLALLSRSAGLSGVVASPLEAKRLRGLLGSEALIVCPGVRPRGAASGDQSRVATPRSTLDAGASHLVIGRPVTEAADPVAAFFEIVEEMGAPALS